MTKYCKGCGAKLQNENKEAIGYVPKLDASYCERCFKIRNYGQVTISMSQKIESNQTFEKIAKIHGTIFWVVDLFAFESNMISRLNQKVNSENIVLILTKRDVLPKTLSDKKIIEFVEGRLKEEKIKVKDILICGYLLRNGEEAKACMDALVGMIKKYRQGRDVVFMGVANAGKSTILNNLLRNENLTTSRHPGTTLDLVEMKQDGYSIYDTPGIENHHSVQPFLNPADLKTIIPTKPIKPFVSQIFEDQSFAAGGLARLDVVVKGKASVVGYFSRSLSIHRGKLENADALWNSHLNGMLSPCLDTSMLTMHTFHAPKLKEQKMDIVIHGLGWFCVSGQIQDIYVRVHKGINVSFRKAMI